MILGLCIRKLNKDVLLQASPLVLCFLIVLTMFESFVHYKLWGSGKSMDFLLVTFFACPLLFVYLNNTQIFNEKLTKSRVDWVKLSIALFLIHPWMMRWYKQLEIDFNYSLCVVLISFVFGFVLVEMNKKIKYLL